MRHNIEDCITISATQRVAFEWPLAPDGWAAAKSEQEMRHNIEDCITISEMQRVAFEWPLAPDGWAAAKSGQEMRHNNRLATS